MSTDFIAAAVKIRKNLLSVVYRETGFRVTGSLLSGD